MPEAARAKLNPEEHTIHSLEQLVRRAPSEDYPALLAALRSDQRAGAVRLVKWLGDRLAEERVEHERLIGLHSFERQARAAGYCLIAGIDEAGRGPLAGPVVAGAAILPPDYLLPGLNDSKQVPPQRREELYAEITSSAIAWSVGEADVEYIERENILQATYEAMRRAIAGLGVAPEYLLLDAVRVPGISLPQQPIIRGDALSASIAAASILAKVTRDRFMSTCDKLYPGYGFAQHKGYGTAEHWQALRQLGPCPLHRLSFLSALGNNGEK